ncbi:MAG: tyrosine-type recombinase/integrase, partial [Bacteroidota bacterium]
MHQKAHITLTPGVHRQKEVILIQFDYSKEIYSKIKTNPKAQWSQTRKSWYIPREDFDLRINAIKFYYEKVLGREKTYYNIDRPRRERKLPDVLSKDEVGAMLRATRNTKHKCILALIYSCGLRRGELINLKLEDVDSK